MRLAIVSSHPIQYYAPLFRKMAGMADLRVFFAHNPTQQDQARAEFGKAFDWDVDLISGYEHEFMENVATDPGLHHFAGCDTPRVSRRLREGRFNAVLLMGWHLKSYLQGLYAAKRLGLPALVRGDSQLDTPRSTLKRAVKSLAYPPFLRFFDAALYVGERSRAYYMHYGYPAARLFHSPHCVDADWFASRAGPDAGAALRARLGVVPETPLLLFAGKLVPRKRPLDLIEAAALVRANGQRPELMVVGEGELREVVDSRAAALSVPLHMLGFRNQTEMPSVYAASDCLVLPSDNDTWGLVANEALACGRPIIVSEACGCSPDLAADDCAGRSFPTGDIRSLATAISAVLSAAPPPQAMAALSAQHSLGAAADGIMSALAHLRVLRG